MITNPLSEFEQQFANAAEYENSRMSFQKNTRIQDELPGRGSMHSTLKVSPDENKGRGVQSPGQDNARWTIRNNARRTTTQDSAAHLFLEFTFQ